MTDAHLFVIGILLAWLAGIRVYLTVFGLGLAGLCGWLQLPPALQATESWWVLGTSGTLALAEFFADKIPGVDSAWDLLQTLTRIPAGAFLAAATLSQDGHLGAGALATGAGVALTSHVLKAGSRALLNTSPEPASNWIASLSEDSVVLATLALALVHPWLALAVSLGASVLGALLVWWVWRTLWRGMRRLLAPPAGGAVARPSQDGPRLRELHRIIGVHSGSLKTRWPQETPHPFSAATNCARATSVPRPRHRTTGGAGPPMPCPTPLRRRPTWRRARRTASPPPVRIKCPRPRRLRAATAPRRRSRWTRPTAS
jgi:hypothetical protein